MKKPKPKKIRKIWAIKPQSRVRPSTKRTLMEKIKKRDTKEGLEW